MKKLALSLLTLTSVAHAAPAEPVNAVDAIMDAPQLVKYYHLAPMQHVGVIAGTALSSAIGYITLLGMANALGYRMDGSRVHARLFEPSEWGWVERIGAITGGALGAYASYNACMPQAGWDPKDREVIDAILNNTNEKDLLAALDLCFVNEHFGRSSAFAHLVRLSAKLTSTKEIFVRVDKRAFASVIDAIDKNIVLVNQTILSIKNQANWFDESKAYSLAHMAATQRAHHNAQLLGTAVQLANN